MSDHFQRECAVKYLKRGFDEASSEKETLDPLDIFIASIANGLIYVGDSLQEIAKQLSETQKGN